MLFAVRFDMPLQAYLLFPSCCLEHDRTTHTRHTRLARSLLIMKTIFFFCVSTQYLHKPNQRTSLLVSRQHSGNKSHHRPKSQARYTCCSTGNSLFIELSIIVASATRCGRRTIADPGSRATERVEARRLLLRGSLAVDVQALRGSLAV